MTTDLSSDFILRERYRVAADQTLPVAIQRFANGQHQASGELVDISVSGARILSDTPLQFGENIILHLESKLIGTGVSIGCQVQWVRGGSSEDEMTVACRFEDHLEKRVLKEYIDDGLLERRQSDRHHTSLPATIKFEGVGKETAEADLLDVGTGGFSFRSPTAGTIGLRVRLILDDATHGKVEGRIMWQSEDDGEYLIGCQWVSRKGISFAKQISDSTDLKPERPSSRLGDHLVGTVVIAVVAFTLGVLSASVRASLSEPSPTSGDGWSVTK